MQFLPNIGYTTITYALPATLGHIFHGYFVREHFPGLKQNNNNFASEKQPRFVFEHNLRKQKLLRTELNCKISN